MSRQPIIVGIVFAILSSLLCVPAVVIAADVDWTAGRQVGLKATPLDICASADGKWLYVLCPAEILIYSFNEDKIVKRIPLDKSVDRMIYIKEKNALVVTGHSGNTIRVIQLEVVNTFSTDGLPHKGPKDAPVTIVVFSDYQCPYCARLEPLLMQVSDKYSKKVKLVIKNFPLTSIHPFAYKAAAAALAADAQGKFWEFNDRLVANYNAINDAKIQEIANELKLDMERFNSAIKDTSIQKLIARDIEEGREAGVEGIPAVFVNGRLPKESSIQGIEALIEAELQKEKKK
jgi:protein-disulfide isomerase